MKQIKQLIKIGGSLYLLIDTNIIEKLSLKEDDYILADIVKADTQIPVKQYQCKKCQLIFETSSDIIYCPACDNETCEEQEDE